VHHHNGPGFQWKIDTSWSVVVVTLRQLRGVECRSNRRDVAVDGSDLSICRERL
jgi:hypothetical protein